MRKLLWGWVWAFLFVALGFAPTPASAVNLLINASFETGDGSGWTTRGAFAVFPGDAHEGARAALMGLRSYARQELVGLQPNRPYRIVAWVRVTATSPRLRGPLLRIGWARSLGGRPFGEAEALNDTAPGWQRLEIVRAFTEKELRRALHVGVTNRLFRGVSLLDDLSVEPLP